MKPKNGHLYESLVQALETSDSAALASALADAPAPDIAESFELLDDDERSRVLFALPPHTAAEVVVMLGEAVRGDVVEDLDTQSLTEIVSELPPDDAADVLGELPTEEADEILEHLEDSRSDKLEELLEYGEETAGGIMTPEVVAVDGSKTVADAVEIIREAPQEEDLHEIYIVDAERKLVGAVPLRRLVTNPSSARLKDLCEADVVSVYANDDQETVVQIIRKYDAMSAAVVDENDRLLGRITHDDLLDVAEEEAAEDLFRMAGTDPEELETGSVLRAAFVRLKWLLPCLLGTMFTASVLMICESKFEPRLAVALVAFAPMIGAMGGNSGIQISTIIVRGFATGEFANTKISRAFRREGRIALAMAPVCGVVAWGLATGGVALLQGMGFAVGAVPHPERLTLAIGVAMTAAILMAGVLAISLPFTFRRLGVDPAIASGPLVTTLNDLISVSIYMALAMLIAR